MIPGSSFQRFWFPWSRGTTWASKSFKVALMIFMLCQGWKPLLTHLIPSPSMVLVTTHLPTVLKLNYWAETNFILASKLYIHWFLSSSTRMSCRHLKLIVWKLNSKYNRYTHLFQHLWFTEWHQYHGMETGNLRLVGNLLLVIPYLVTMSCLFYLMNSTTSPPV